MAITGTVFARVVRENCDDGVAVASTTIAGSLHACARLHSVTLANVWRLETDWRLMHNIICRDIAPQQYNESNALGIDHT